MAVAPLQRLAYEAEIDVAIDEPAADDPRERDPLAGSDRTVNPNVYCCPS